MKQFDEIDDDEIREICSKPNTPEAKHPVIGFLIAFIVLALLVLGCFLAISKHTETHKQTELIQADNNYYETISNESPTTIKSEVFTYDTVCNNITLKFIIPVNLRPLLFVGKIDSEDPQIIVATRAADIREDNGEIVGACVVDGNILSYGIAKSGYCAIINDSISLGNAKNTSLFDESVECNGHFFRQYALVDNGKTVWNRSKFKSNRIALCQTDKGMALVITNDAVTFNYFAETLLKVGCQNAIALNGGKAYGWYVNDNGDRIFHGKQYNSDFTTYIVWVKK